MLAKKQKREPVESVTEWVTRMYQTKMIPEKWIELRLTGKFKLDFHMKTNECEVSLSKLQSAIVTPDEIAEALTTLIGLMDVDPRFTLGCVLKNYCGKIDFAIPETWLTLNEIYFLKKSLTVSVEVIVKEYGISTKALHTALFDEANTVFERGSQNAPPTPFEMYSTRINITRDNLGSITYGDILSKVQEHDVFERGSAAMLSQNQTLARVRLRPPGQPYVPKPRVFVPLPPTLQLLEIRPKLTDDQIDLVRQEIFSKRVDELPNEIDHCLHFTYNCLSVIVIGQYHPMLRHHDLPEFTFFDEANDKEANAEAKA